MRAPARLSGQDRQQLLPLLVVLVHRVAEDADQVGEPPLRARAPHAVPAAVLPDADDNVGATLQVVVRADGGGERRCRSRGRRPPWGGAVGPLAGVYARETPGQNKHTPSG